MIDPEILLILEDHQKQLNSAKSMVIELSLLVGQLLAQMGQGQERMKELERQLEEIKTHEREQQDY